MSISPFAVGQTLPIMQVQLFVDSSLVGGVVPATPTPLDVSSLNAGNFRLNIFNTLTRVDQVGNGYFVIVTPATGIVQYVWDTADTAAPGAFQLFISATFGTGVLTFDPIPFIVAPK